MIGSYYCFDNPSALNKQLQHYWTSLVSSAPAATASGEAPSLAPLIRFSHAPQVADDVRMTDEQYTRNFNLLYSVYSIPNVILPFFGGYFTDRWGARVVNILCCSFCLCGQFLVALGCKMQLFWLMLAGRVVFGFGGESLCVSQSAIIQQWFMASLSDDCQKKINGVVERSCAARYGVSTHSRNRSHHTAIARDAAEPRSRASEKQLGLAFAMGLNLSLSRVGSTINNYMSPFLANHFATAAGRVVCPHRTLPPPQLDPHASL